MRQGSAGLTRRVSLALVIALMGALVFAFAVSAKPAEPLAPTAPNLPACFAGLVTAENGAPLPGMTVVARGVSGYWSGRQVSTVSDSLGRYGFDPLHPFCVPGYEANTEPLGARPGDQIAFFVNGIPALLYDVATGTRSTTYTFVYGGGSPTLNLVVALNETITATAGPNGSINPSGSVNVPYGTDKTFTFTPAAGYQIDQVLVDGQANPGAATAGSYTFQNVRGNHTIHVTFIRSNYAITVAAGQGCVITPAGNQIVPLHGNITFAIAAQTGYTLVEVKVDEVSKGAANEVTILDVTGDHVVTATCVRQSFTVTPEAGTNGKITPGTPQTVFYGEGVTFQIQPDLGYVVEDVLVNGVSQGAVASYTFSNVTANATIKATFKQQSFTVTPEAGPNGKIVPGTAQTVLYGGNVTFQIQPDQGYVVFDVLVNGVPQGARSSYTFENVTANATIKATFAKQVFKVFLPLVMK